MRFDKTGCSAGNRARNLILTIEHNAKTKILPGKFPRILR